MKRKIVWLVVSCLMVLALLATSCAKKEEAAAPAPTEKAAPAVTEKAAPAVKEAAPAVKEAAPAVPAGMVKVSATKIDGTVVEKLIEKPRYGGTFVMNATFGGPQGFDEALPGVPPYSSQIFWTSQTQEELLGGRWDRGPAGTNEIGWKSTGYWANPDVYQGVLAESWEFPDNTTIIFHIRQGVHYALNPASEASRLVNGREFTAEDAAYSIRRIYIDSPSSTMYNMALASKPTDVYTTDKYTLVVKNPAGQQGYTWEYVGDWMSNYPPEVIEKYGDMNDWENVVGTGPFILTDYIPMGSGTFVRNPNYWMKDPLLPENQLPYIDQMKALIIPDDSTMQAAVRTGKVDTYIGSDEEQSKLLIKMQPQLKYVTYLTPVYFYLGFRLDKQLPFNDIRVRRALHMAINWKEIVDTLYKGHGEYLVYKVMPLKESPDILAAYTPVGQLPPSPDGFDNNKLYTYHPEEAKQLLAEAGYPNGFKTETITFVCSSFGNIVDQQTIFKDYWQKNLNVDLAIDVKEYGVYYAMVTRKTYNEGIIQGRWGDQPYAMCNVRSGSEYNTAMFSDPKIDDYYNQMTAAYFEGPKRTQILKEMNQYVISQVYYYVPPAGYSYAFWWPWVKGYSGEQGVGVDNVVWMKYIWLDTELKKSMGY